MSRQVLLVEPNYKNKYPPIGLMKLASYHKRLGDTVRFFKGDLRSFILFDITEEAINKLNKIDNVIDWRCYYDEVYTYIKKGKNEQLAELWSNSKFKTTLEKWCLYYKSYWTKEEYKNNPKWDRICITSLFTFYWKETIDAINIAKMIVKDKEQIFAGGVMATVLHDELKKETGINVHSGLLDKAGVLDNNDIIIDTLPLDYSILFEIDYKYPADNAFYAYTTRGCKNRCSFCAVPVLEPEFNEYISIVDSIENTKKITGDMPNLLLMDNNVLQSPCFNKIIEDIKSCGFAKGAIFNQVDYLELYIKNLKAGINDFGFIRALFLQYQQLLCKMSGDDKQIFYDVLKTEKMFNIHTAAKEGVYAVYKTIKPFYKKYLPNSERMRIVDFNQGLDAALISKEKARLLSQIAIKPLRIAFDSVNDKNNYIRAIKNCVKYNIHSFSNYLLYNEKDKPSDLYSRLKINILLCEKYGISIYSFPMKYHPIFGEYSKNRNYIGPKWCKKYIRAIQTILNATKGKIGRGKSFFYKAFGRSKTDYKLLLLMPEPYLLYRFFFEHIGRIQRWKEAYLNLNTEERHELFKLIRHNTFSKKTYRSISNNNIKLVYKHYLVKRDDVTDASKPLGKKKVKYDIQKKEEESATRVKQAIKRGGTL